MATQLQDIKNDAQKGNNELARRAAHPITGKTDFLDKRKDLLGAGIPGHMAVEREIRTATVMLMQSKDLQAAAPQSFYVAVSIAINSGIGLGNGKGYLVAYKGNVSYVPGWKGLIDLVSRTGRASAWTGVVHKGDTFDYALGDSPFLTHKPGDNEDHADITHYYAIGRVKGSEWPHIVVWSVPKVIKHLSTYNKVGGKHYAVKNDDNMEAYGRKVVLLQVIKYLPTSVELENAIAAENANASGKSAKVENTIDGNFVYINEDDAEQPGEAEPVPRTDYSVKPTREEPSENDIRRERAETVEVRERVDQETGEVTEENVPAAAPKGAPVSPEDSAAYESLMAQIYKAKDLDALAEAADLIKDIGNIALREALTKAYKKRMVDFEAVEDAPAPDEPAAPVKRARRTAPPVE